MTFTHFMCLLCGILIGLVFAALWAWCDLADTFERIEREDIGDDEPE